MGSAALGGGSGSFGGGSGGSGGPGGGDSVASRFRRLLGLTDELNASRSLSAARSFVHKAIQDRGRQGYLKHLFGAEVVIETYRSLLELGRAAEQGGAPALATVLGLPATASLQNVAEALAQRAAGSTADERHVETLRTIVSRLLLSSVGNERDAYYRTAVDALGNRFDPSVFRNAGGSVVAGLLAETIRRDVQRIDPRVGHELQRACAAIATGWTDDFRKRYVDRGKATWPDLLKTISVELPRFAKVR